MKRIKPIEAELTNRAVTETAIGPISHRRHPLGFMCPVALMTEWAIDRRTGLRIGRTLKKDSANLPFPDVDQTGQMVYVTPGGGRWQP